MGFTQHKSSQTVHSAGAVVYRVVKEELEVLLIKSSSTTNYWGIPKGRQNKDETIADAAVREIMEETGVSVELESYVGEFDVNYKNGHKIVHVYIASPVNQNERVNTEHPECEVFAASWFNVKELPMIQPAQEQCVLNAIFKIRQAQEDHA